MLENAPPGWYPAGGSTGLRWWDGTRWTEHVAAPGSVLDRNAFEVSRTKGQAWYSLTDPSGACLGDAYEVRTGPQQMQPVPMGPDQFAQPPPSFRSLEVVIRDTRQAHLLWAVRPGPEPLVAICGPDRTPLGTASYTTEVSQRVIAVTMGGRPAYRIVLPNRGSRSGGKVRFSVQRPDGAEVAGLTLRRAVIRLPAGTAAAAQRAHRFAMAISLTEPQPPPASGLVGALPVALFALLMPTFGSPPLSPADLAALGGKVVAGMAKGLLDALEF